MRPLNDAAAADLMQVEFPEISPKVRRRLLNEAQGNPLALLELPSALNGPQLAAVEALPDVLPLTGRLEALFASRIADLPAGTRDALLLSALEGGGDLRILRMAGDGDNYLNDLAPAEQARLVTVELASRRILFRHPLVRSAIVELSTNVERRRAHWRSPTSSSTNPSGGPGIWLKPPSNRTKRSQPCSSRPRTERCSEATPSVPSPR